MLSGRASAKRDAEPEPESERPSESEHAMCPRGDQRGGAERVWALRGDGGVRGAGAADRLSASAVAAK